MLPPAALEQCTSAHVLLLGPLYHASHHEAVISLPESLVPLQMAPGVDGCVGTRP